MGLPGVFVLLALVRVSLGLGSGGHSRCPCIENHTDLVKLRLSHNGMAHDRFGIECDTHPLDEALAVKLYGDEAGARLKCDQVSECPWSQANWCYVNMSDCSLDWDLGVLGVAYSYATCGNLRNGTAEYLPRSLAAFLHHDVLRVFHLENTLDHGYMGTTDCHESHPDRPEHLKCDGLVAEFWSRSLGVLSQYQVNIDHSVISTDRGFDANISAEFEAFKLTYPEKWAGRDSSNYDLCAFAAGMGYVDLCVASLGLTHERQQLAFQIELYTAPVFMVSKSTCGFLATSNPITSEYWTWWLSVFSAKAWGFFVAVVFVLTLTMCFLDHSPAKNAKKFEKMKSSAEYQRHALADLILGVFEAFVNKSRSTYSREAKVNNSRPSYMLRLGLNFFLLMTTSIYFASITAQLISAKEKKGEVSSLMASRNTQEYPVNLCVHEVYRESMKLAGFLEEDNATTKILPIYADGWQDVKRKLKDDTCNATLLEEEVWHAWRAEGDLCDFYLEPKPQFYMPVGAFASKRAYRTLETFRFNPAESGAFLNQSRIPKSWCPGSADKLCGDEDGVPWFTFSSLGLVAVLCCCFGIVDHGCIEKEGQGEEDLQETEARVLEKVKRLLKAACDDIRSTTVGTDETGSPADSTSSVVSV
mmetsp:Transcript_63515/g.151792  ORF Transcript_63515/g.151792 Transcript_63515/m.151792 type:complete len:643 (-) Transcript_63515:124-2052(-)